MWHGTMASLCILGILGKFLCGNGPRLNVHSRCPAGQIEFPFAQAQLLYDLWKLGCISSRTYMGTWAFLIPSSLCVCGRERGGGGVVAGDLGRGHDAPAVHGGGVQVARRPRLGQQSAHQLRCRTIEWRRQPVAVRAWSVASTRWRNPNQRAALCTQRDRHRQHTYCPIPAC